MHVNRPIAVLAGLALACTLAACGSGTASPPISAPSSSTSVSTTPTTSPTSPASTSTTTGSATASGARNLVATASDKSALTAAFVAYKNVPAHDIAGTAPGTVYYAYVPATQTYWALAAFLPTPTASQQTLVGLQDGGGTGIFNQKSGGPWTMIALGSFPFCPAQTAIPPAVQSVWGLTEPEACSTQG